MGKIFSFLLVIIFALAFLGCKKVEERIEKRVEQVKDARETAEEANKKILESQKKAKEAMAEAEKK
ncbi:MAG: hypothetical protein HQL10_07220 [Nitrospirae bacterium]|nr:hypothetical protein [Nitrospirota bacterium]